MANKRLRILTWHVHGNYLYYLTQVPHTFYVLVDSARSAGYSGRSGQLPWGDNVVELPVEQARSTEFDCILFQSLKPYQIDQQLLLTPEQQRLPRIYLEHDPPREQPSDTRHPVDNANMLLVHVTHFNCLMWDNGRTPTRVIEHGVIVPENLHYAGTLPRGIAVINHLEQRGRRLGADIFAAARKQVAIDLVGMDSERSQGLGEISNLQLPAFMAHYRFYFHPVRWTSLGLAAIEAMMLGLPVVGLATTELATVIRDGESGFIDTRLDRLVVDMRRLIARPDEARQLGIEARKVARERFNIDRFINDWLAAFRAVTS